MAGLGVLVKKTPAGLARGTTTNPAAIVVIIP